MLEYENAKRYRASCLLCAFTFCPESVEIQKIFRLFRPESVHRLCHHSFFFRLDYDREAEICYYATGRQLIGFEVFVTYKKEADHWQPLFLI